MKKITTEIAEEIRAWFESADVRGVIDATKAADSNSGTFEVIITTENVDRYQEVIKLDGWELEHYRNNPVVLWGHDHHLLPIGVADSVEAKDGGLVAKGRFATHAHAQEIRQLYDLGIVRATSVGFIEKEREGNLITRAELLEFSFVSVPANPYALSLAMEKELNINELVTKGFMNIKEAEPVVEAPTVEPVVEVPPEPTPEEKKFAQKAVASLIDQAKALVVALEALTTEPEREEEPAAETEEEKQFKEFSEKRKTLQDAVTVLGDVLAEARQAMEAKKN